MIHRVTHSLVQSAPARVKVAVPAPFPFALDYLPGEGAPPAIGTRVRVPLGKRQVVGVVMESTDEPIDDGIRCKPIESVLDSEEPALPEHSIDLCRWASNYYQHPIGEVVAAALPALLRRTEPVTPRKRNKKQSLPAADRPPELTTEQAEALAALDSPTQSFAVHLLEGVTGSGKTEIYLRRVQAMLDAGKQCLILVPEIGLTPQLLSRFQARFGEVVGALHSAMSDRDRSDTWMAARQGHCRVLIGTRSAVFAPLPELGLIVVDEEHDASYKQQEGFRYHARDLSIVLAQRHDAQVILGSATPSLESLANVEAGRYRHLTLRSRVHARALPPVQVADLRGVELDKGLSPALIDACDRHLAANGQVLVYLNRRGFAPALLCHDCGWTAACAHCDARLVMHRHRNQLRCHHCGSSASIPATCGNCSGTSLIPVGQGTERIEESLRARFPDARIEVMDSDRSRRAGELDRLLRDFRSRDIDVLVGTQMLTKGHDFEGLTLVCIVDADDALFSTDFRALERLGQSLTQVAGRAGRGLSQGEVLLQTHQPDHPSLQAWLGQGYSSLAAPLLEDRRLARLPPFASLTLIRADSLDAERALHFLDEVAQCAAGLGGLEIMGPIPAPMERRANRYRAQLLLRTETRPQMQKSLKQLRGQIAAIPASRRLRWSVDVDPIDLY